MLRTLLVAGLILVSSLTACADDFCNIGTVPAGVGREVNITRSSQFVGITIRQAGGRVQHSTVISFQEAKLLAAYLEQGWRELGGVEKDGGRLIGSVSGVSVVIVNAGGGSSVMLSVWDVTRGAAILSTYPSVAALTTYLRTAVKGAITDDGNMEVLNLFGARLRYHRDVMRDQVSKNAVDPQVALSAISDCYATHRADIDDADMLMM